MRWARQLRDVVVHRVIGVDDSPHRIAMGVFWGFLVAWTPTIGLQTGIYLTVVTLARANRLSGLPIIMVSNPFTAVPIFYVNWWVGSLVLHGGQVDWAAGRRFVDTQLHAWTSTEDGSLLERVWTVDFWVELGASLLEVGAELWLGSLLMGALVGLVAYAATRRAIAAYRRRHPHRRGRPDPPRDSRGARRPGAG